MTDDRPLDGAYAKLDWAARHLQAMVEALDQFHAKSDRGSALTLEFDTRGKPRGRIVVRFRLDAPIPIAISLQAGDVVHNTRVALDHMVAALKAVFGGDPGRGGFPACPTASAWESRVVEGPRPLCGLEETPAWQFIYGVQPLHAESPNDDPITVLHDLDNADKHRLINRVYVHTEASNGLGLIEILDKRALLSARSLWDPSQPLESGTQVAELLFRPGDAGRQVRARADVDTSFAVGDPTAGHTRFDAMLQRTREILDGASDLLDNALQQA